ELERGASLPATGPGGAEDDGVARRRTRTPVAEELGIGEEVAPRLRAVPGVQVPPAVRAETASQEQLAHLRRRIEGERTEGLVVIRPARERATERDLDLVAEADVLLAAEGIEPLTLDPPHVPPPEEEEEPERIQLAHLPQDRLGEGGVEGRGIIEVVALDVLGGADPARVREFDEADRRAEGRESADLASPADDGDVEPLVARREEDVLLVIAVDDVVEEAVVATGALSRRPPPDLADEGVGERLPGEAAGTDAAEAEVEVPPSPQELRRRVADAVLPVRVALEEEELHLPAGTEHVELADPHAAEVEAVVQGEAHVDAGAPLVLRVHDDVPRRVRLAQPEDVDAGKEVKPAQQALGLLEHRGIVAVARTDQDLAADHVLAGPD